MQTPPDRRALPRRDVLRALAVAPAALAGCAAARGGGATPDGGVTGAAPAAHPSGPLPEGAVAAIRAFRLPTDAEPASIFRAAGARPAEAR